MEEHEVWLWEGCWIVIRRDRQSVRFLDQDCLTLLTVSKLMNTHLCVGTTYLCSTVSTTLKSRRGSTPSIDQSFCSSDPKWVAHLHHSSPLHFIDHFLWLNLLLSKDFFSNPLQTMRDVVSFLSLPPSLLDGKTNKDFERGESCVVSSGLISGATVWLT